MALLSAPGSAAATRSSPVQDVVPPAAGALRLAGFGSDSRRGGSAASAASLARSRSLGRVPSAAGRSTSRGGASSCGSDGVSEATCTALLGRVRSW